MGQDSKGRKPRIEPGLKGLNTSSQVWSAVTAGALEIRCLVANKQINSEGVEIQTVPCQTPSGLR